MNISISIIGYQDLYLSTTYALLLGLVIYFYGRRKMKNDTYRKYFYVAFVLRLFATVFMAAFAQFYFKGGDNITYYYKAIQLRTELLSHPKDTMISLWTLFIENSYTNTGGLVMGFGDGTANIITISGLTSLLTFGNYLPIAFLFSIFALLGSWKIFSIYAPLYPRYAKYIAGAILFLPSVVYWSSGILKDALSLGAFGFLFHSLYSIFILRKGYVEAIVKSIIFGWLLLHTKPYILLVLVPSMILWVGAHYWNSNMLSHRKRGHLILNISLVLILVGSFIFGFGYFSDRFAINNILNEIDNLKGNHWSGSSDFNIDKFNFDSYSIFTVLPRALGLTLFRPYLWEVKTPLQFFASLESLFGFVLFAFTIAKVRLAMILKFTLRPELLFALVFTIVFATFVGLTTFNFGTLVRYKIPCLPFFYLYLFGILIRNKEANAQVN